MDCIILIAFDFTLRFAYLTWSWSYTSGTLFPKNVRGVFIAAFSAISHRYSIFLNRGVSSLTSVTITVISVIAEGGGRTLLPISVA